MLLLEELGRLELGLLLNAHPEKLLILGQVGREGGDGALAGVEDARPGGAAGAREERGAAGAVARGVGEREEAGARERAVGRGEGLEERAGRERVVVRRGGGHGEEVDGLREARDERGAAERLHGLHGDDAREQRRAVAERRGVQDAAPAQLRAQPRLRAAPQRRPHRPRPAPEAHHRRPVLLRPFENPLFSPFLFWEMGRVGGAGKMGEIMMCLGSCGVK